MLSGQRRWTVNPLSDDFVGSNPTLPIFLFIHSLGGMVDTTVLKTVDFGHMGSSPIVSTFLINLIRYNNYLFIVKLVFIICGYLIFKIIHFIYTNCRYDVVQW